MTRNDQNRVSISGTVQWVGDREVRAGVGPRQSIGLESLKESSGAEDLLKLTIVVPGDPVAVRRGDALLIQGRLIWDVDERHGRKAGRVAVLAEEVTILERRPLPVARPHRAPEADRAGRAARRPWPRQASRVLAEDLAGRVGA